MSFRDSSSHEIDITWYTIALPKLILAKVLDYGGMFRVGKNDEGELLVVQAGPADDALNVNLVIDLHLAPPCWYNFRTADVTPGA